MTTDGQDLRPGGIKGGRILPSVGVWEGEQPPSAV